MVACLVSFLTMGIIWVNHHELALRSPPWEGAVAPRGVVAWCLLAMAACAPSSSASPPPATTHTPAALVSPQPASPTPASPAGCRSGDPLAGVYNPQRLQVLAPCRTATGTVLRVIEERDGDHHLWIRLDAGQAGLLGAGNSYHGSAALLAEILPQHCGGVPQQDAESNCADSGGFTTPSAPVTGGHVTVTGPWVLDTVHGWNEIHPVWVVGP